MSVFAPPCVDELAAFLAANPVCCTLTPTEVAEVVFALQVREVAPGELIIREGEPGDAWFLVYRGVCEVQRAEQLLARLHVGAFFGEMSVLDGAPRSATVQAKSAVTLLRCPSSVLQALLQAGSLAAHKVVLEMTRELARRMRALLDDSSRATLEVRTPAAAASRASEG